MIQSLRQAKTRRGRRRTTAAVRSFVPEAQRIAHRPLNEVLAQADAEGLLGGEHFSVDGTLIQAWASHKSFVHKDGEDDGDGSDFKGQKRSNDTHESKSDRDARLYRKGKTASELRYMGHTLADNRHGLIANARVTQADGHAEREAAKVMINDALTLRTASGHSVPVGQIARIEPMLEEGGLWIRNRLPTLSVRADVAGAQAPDVSAEVETLLREQISCHASLLQPLI